MPELNIKKKTKMQNSRPNLKFFNFPSLLKPKLFHSAEKILNFKTGAICIVLVSDKQIVDINKKFLKRDHITDIITFILSKKPLWGDIYIAEGQSKKQAKEAGHAWEDELVYLVLHGCLHLLDYKDYTPAQKKTMFKIQDKLFTEIKNERVSQ